MDPSYGAQYAELYRRHWWWRAREESILEVIASLRSGRGAGRFLDVGCGDALLFNRLLPFGTVEGVEPDQALVSEESRRRFRIHLGQFDHTYQFQEPFDVILFLDVLEHLDDPVAAVRRAIDCLTPGGTILVTVPAYRWLWTSHDELNHHRTRYSPTDLRRLVLAAGGHVVELRHLFHWLVLPKLMLRIFERCIDRLPELPRVPPSVVNAALLGVCRIEKRMARLFDFSWGSSIIATIMAANSDGKGESHS